MASLTRTSVGCACTLRAQPRNGARAKEPVARDAPEPADAMQPSSRSVGNHAQAVTRVLLYVLPVMFRMDRQLGAWAQREHSLRLVFWAILQSTSTRRAP